MKKDMKELSYVGKDVFIGIDVHKKTYVVVARVEGEVVKKWTTAASPQALAQQLLKYFAGAKHQNGLRSWVFGIRLASRAGEEWYS